MKEAPGGAENGEEKMRASELIEEIKKITDVFGDCDVKVVRLSAPSLEREFYGGEFHFSIDFEKETVGVEEIVVSSGNVRHQITIK